MYLPFKPTKNVAFRLYFDLMGNAVSATNRYYVNFYPFSTQAKISKDGASFVNTTNNCVSIDTGRGYIDLTQEEMNADIVLISMNLFNGSNDSACGGAVCIEIYTTTTTASSGITAQDVWEYATRTITGGSITVDNTTLLASIKKLFHIFRK